MKTYLLSVLIGLHVVSSVSYLLRSPRKKDKESLVEEQAHASHKLIPSVAKKQWAERTHKMRVHMLARDEPSDKKKKQAELKTGEEKVEKTGEEKVEECIACKGEAIVYGKYRNFQGDEIDNTCFLFKDPAVKGKLPVVIQFHAGGFYSGEPWRKENAEIKGYLKAGFAVVSVGYRLATEKYFYEDEYGANKTEELIHVSEEGKLSLDETGQTMEFYEVRVGEQEFITKFLYDATQMMEHLIKNADNLGVDINRTVFVGESTGGAAIQYLTWVYHQWNEGRYTPRGIVYHNAQLNYPVNNMLSEAWGLFAETMGPQVKLSDVVSPAACPTIVGNHMCGSELGNASDYNLCNAEWNERSMREFCGVSLKSKTLAQAQARQVWQTDDNASIGMEKLWYASENMQKHMPSDPFYIYVANTMNGTDALDVAHHSVYALNFAKFAEMGKHGGHQYTVYYSDFAHMTEADRGIQRLEVMAPPTSLKYPSAAMVPVGASPSAVAPPSLVYAPAPAQAPAPAPAPGPAFAVAGPVVLNYLSTHGWREDVAEAQEIDAGSMEERVLYASLAVGIGPFKEIENTTTKKPSGAHQNTLLGVLCILVALVSFQSINEE